MSDGEIAGIEPKGVKTAVSFRFRDFVIGLTIGVVLAGTVTLVFGVSFWITLLIVVVAMLVNGYVLEVEDRERGL